MHMQSVNKIWYIGVGGRRVGLVVTSKLVGLWGRGGYGWKLGGEYPQKRSFLKNRMGGTW